MRKCKSVRFSQTNDSMFACGIRCSRNVERRCNETIHGCYIDNRSPTRAVRVGEFLLLEHLADLSTLALPDSGCVNGKDSFKIVLGNLVGSFDGATDASVVDCVVESAEFLDGLLYAVVDGLFVGHVELELLDGDIWCDLLELADRCGDGVAIQERE